MGHRFRRPIFSAFAFWLAIVVMLSGCLLTSQLWRYGTSSPERRMGWRRHGASPEKSAM